MQKKPWKLIAYIPGLNGAPGFQEYFIVRGADAATAIAALLTARTDLSNIQIEVKGEADKSFLDWLQPDRDVFSIMVLS
jgi:hypothetical protein